MASRLCGVPFAAGRQRHERILSAATFSQSEPFRTEILQPLGLDGWDGDPLAALETIKALAASDRVSETSFDYALIKLCLVAQAHDAAAALLERRYGRSFRVTSEAGDPSMMRTVRFGRAADDRMVFRFVRFGPSDIHFNVVDRWLEMMPLWAATFALGGPKSELLINLADEPLAGAIEFCTNISANVLIPDPCFVGTGGYWELRTAFDCHPPWQSRRDVVLWRGSTSGVRTGLAEDLPRVRLCRLARSPGARDLFDAGLTQYVQLDADEEATVRALNLDAGWVSDRNYGQYRYHVDIDGNCSAWSSLYTKLLSGGLVFKVASPFGFRQWYYDKLKPWRHFIPVASDLGDLVDKVAWARRNDRKARRIAERGRRLALRLNCAKELRRAARRLAGLMPGEARRAGGWLPSLFRRSRLFSS